MFDVWCFIFYMDNTKYMLDCMENNIDMRDLWVKILYSIHNDDKCIYVSLNQWEKNIVGF